MAQVKIAPGTATDNQGGRAEMRKKWKKTKLLLSVSNERAVGSAIKDNTKAPAKNRGSSSIFLQAIINLNFSSFVLIWGHWTREKKLTSSSCEVSYSCPGLSLVKAGSKNSSCKQWCAANVSARVAHIFPFLQL